MPRSISNRSQVFSCNSFRSLLKIDIFYMTVQSQNISRRLLIYHLGNLFDNAGIVLPPKMWLLFDYSPFRMYGKIKNKVLSWGRLNYPIYFYSMLEP